jgi:dihydroflavonol-4-reductase
MKGQEQKMTYFITGATGHLGYHLIQSLVNEGHLIYAFVLPNDPLRQRIPKSVTVIEGNLLDKPSLALFLNQSGLSPRVLIHTASRISTDMKPDPATYAVNVTGTVNILSLISISGIDHMIYVSSVHALKDLPRGQVVNEQHMAQPKEVVGYYAKTKAEATQKVWQAYIKDHLPISIVYPSGFIGPSDHGQGYTTVMIKDIAERKLKFWFHGGYDFVDVRDVANAIIKIADQKRIGKTYVLNHDYVSFAHIMNTIDDIKRDHPKRMFISNTLIRFALPWMTIWSRLRGQKPRLNRYALITLASQPRFDHAQASLDLAYRPRPFQTTIQDTLDEFKHSS